MSFAENKDRQDAMRRSLRGVHIVRHYACMSAKCSERGVHKEVEYPVNEDGVALTCVVVCATCDNDAAQVS